MESKRRTRLLHILLRPTFGALLFVSQFTASRSGFAADNRVLFILGLAVVVTGAVVFTWATLSLIKAADAKRVAEAGPFRFIRHPIYTSMYVICTGMGLIFFAWLWFIVMVAFIPLWYLEAKEEEKQMTRLYGKSYTDYQTKTGMFLPKIR